MCILTRLTIRPGFKVMSRGPGRLVEMSRFFVCLGRSLKNSQKPWVAGVKTFFFRRSPEKSRKNYDCPGSLSEKYGNPNSDSNSIKFQ